MEKKEDWKNKITWRPHTAAGQKLVGKLIVNYLNAAISVFCAAGMCEARAAITLVAIVCLYSLLLHKSFTTIKKKNEQKKKLLPLSPLVLLVLVLLTAVCNLSFTPRARLRIQRRQEEPLQSAVLHPRFQSYNIAPPHPTHFTSIFPTHFSAIQTHHPAFLMAANTRVRRDHFHNAAQGPPASSARIGCTMRGTVVTDRQ